ncbi:DUF1769-domain-containing protein [Hymenopellis radicata]|nr:DUF1769-domain-containing protein [Hymenopellis radicata]
MPRLRVLAGPSVESLEPITAYVNKNKPFGIKSDAFEGCIVVNIKGLEGSDDCEYFARPERQGITWSIQVQGRFLKSYSSNDILFGNTFDRPLGLPWGSGAALKFMNYVDPTLEHDLTSSTKPWALSPLVATMPHFSHTQEEPPQFPPRTPLVDDTSNLYLAVTSSSPDVFFKKEKETSPDLSSLTTASKRRAYFASEPNRRTITFGRIFLLRLPRIPPLTALRLPGGLSFDLMRYWDGQPVRFVCCERGTGDQPWGRVFWCLSIESEDELQESDPPA